MSVVSDDLPPDLLVTVLTVPATAIPGTSMVVSDTTKNQGGGAAFPSATGFYLSTNVLLDAADTFLGARALPSMGGGAVHSGSMSVAIPAGTATGTYYVLAKADNANAIVETQEFNNIKFSSPIRVGPDLDHLDVHLTGWCRGRRHHHAERRNQEPGKCGRRCDANRVLFLRQCAARCRRHAAGESCRGRHRGGRHQRGHDARADSRGHGDRDLLPVRQGGSEQRGPRKLGDQQRLVRGGSPRRA